MSESNSYDESDIKLIPLREHARLRPGMYIGGTHLNALHNLINIPLDDSIDEVLAGHTNHIWITLGVGQEITIRRNGRGVSAKVEDGKPSFLEILMTKTGVLRVNGDYLITHSIHGSICFFAVNALSTQFKIESACDGFLWQQTYREGIPQSKVIRVRELGENEPNGVSFTFRPDFSIFEPNEFDYEMVAQRAQDLAYLLPNLTITLRDEREAAVKTDEYHFPNGLLDLVSNLNQGKSVFYGPMVRSNEWTIRTQNDRTIPSKDNEGYTLGVDIFFQYNDSMETNIIGFIDLQKTSSGFHTDIVPLTTIANHLMTHLRLEKPLSFEEVAPGLTIVIHLKHPASYRRNEYLGLITPPPGVCGIVAATIDRLFHPYSGDRINEPVVQKWLANRNALQENEN